MAWIEFHATRIVKLKKFQDFRTNLQLSKHEALGLLGSFWCEVLELRETGDITDWTPDYLGELLGLKLSPERVWKALEAGWLDDVNGRKVVHDWWDTAGKYLTSKYRNTEPAKLHQIKEMLTVTSLKSRAPLKRPKGRLPNLTIPNLTNQLSMGPPPTLPPKDLYLSSVFLSKDEYQKLFDKFGDEGTKQRIYDLNNGIMSKGYKYKSHYHTILSWERKDEKSRTNAQSSL